MKLMAFDLGATIGCCWGEPMTLNSSYRYVPGIEIWAWALPKGDSGRRFAAAENEMIKAIEFYQPDIIIKEAPLHPHPRLKKNEDGSVGIAGSTSAAVLSMHAGLHAMIESTGYRHGYVCGKTMLTIKADDARNAILGRCRLTKVERAEGKTMKHVVATRLSQLGWADANHNAADALLLFLYYAGRMTSRDLRAA